MAPLRHATPALWHRCSWTLSMVRLVLGADLAVAYAIATPCDQMLAPCREDSIFKETSLPSLPAINIGSGIPIERLSQTTTNFQFPSKTPGFLLYLHIFHPFSKHYIVYGIHHAEGSASCHCISPVLPGCSCRRKASQFLYQGRMRGEKLPSFHRHFGQRLPELCDL